ncbi:c4-dicarboxylate abc transporter [Leptolyngbya sp. Heron Island J]|uniref:TRAP transporter large permease n=1 Tax=Leptolyngbya sp. Heron Island J TaxID=1385935 RepID=UPI0003B9F3B0|nr:TRAP transporter large permease subunit [Leptolyngbya sp. Heron Island J]ESA37597.1 c4-dicarboxylate abc transporter [Leptolyngbya sp. Heron Island J]
MLTDWLGPLMFGGALVLLSLGYPVAFSLGGVAILFGSIGIALGVFDPVFLTAMPQRIFGIMNNFTLLAIPYFIFMGAMLEKSGIAENLLETMGSLFGRLRGGLAIAVVVVGALLAATTGVVAATVVTMGLISLPTMLRHGYNKDVATGVIAASGTLGQIIPPSIVLVVLADQLGVSVGDLFLGSFIPGLLMAGVFVVHVAVIALVRPDLLPALPPDLLKTRGQALVFKVCKVMVPPLVLILLVLGSIFFGIATPTEAGALGAVGAMILAAFNRQLTISSLREVCDSTLRTTTMVIFILLGSTAFSLVFRGLRGDSFIFDVLTNLPGGSLGFLVVSMVTIFILGFFIDFFEIAFIVIPLFAPVAQQLGLDLVWYGVIIGANMQTSFLTPPFGFALFYLRGVAPKDVSTANIYRGVVPFIALQLLVLVAIIAFPSLVNWLPSISS